MTAVSGSGTRIMSDSWISWKPRIDEPSKPKPSSKASSDTSSNGHREVLHQSGKVREPDVDELGAVLLAELQYVGWANCHASSLSHVGSLSQVAVTIKARRFSGVSMVLRVRYGGRS